MFVLQGGTPLHYFVWYDNRKERLDFLVSLLTDRDKPVDVNAKTEEGNTALHLAVKVSCCHKCWSQCMLHVYIVSLHTEVFPYHPVSTCTCVGIMCEAETMYIVHVHVHDKLPFQVSSLGPSDC